MITILHRGGYGQKITVLHREGGSTETPKSDYVIYVWPLRKTDRPSTSLLWNQFLAQLCKGKLSFVVGFVFILLSCVLGLVSECHLISFNSQTETLINGSFYCCRLTSPPKITVFFLASFEPFPISIAIHCIGSFNCCRSTSLPNITVFLASSQLYPPFPLQSIGYISIVPDWCLLQI